MKDIAGRVFRHTGKVRVLGAGGTVQEGRGVIARWKGRQGDPLGVSAHPVGPLEEPLYVFTGSRPQMVPGDSLEQGDGRYTVLHSSRLCLGDTLVCTRAVLEKQEAGNERI